MILHELDAISDPQQEFRVRMKGFGFRLGVAFVCLSASIALAGNENTTESNASAKPCGILVSERAYGNAPMARITIDRALQHERLGPRIAQFLEAIVWLGEQDKTVWTEIASGLRNSVYNPVPTNSPLNNLPTYLRTEKGRAELLRVMEEDFTTPPSYDTLQLLAELLDRYPRVPYLPQNADALSQLFTALTLSGAKSFYETHFSNYRHAFITFAAHHWVKFEGDARKVRDREKVARQMVRDHFIPAQFQQMLHTYMVQFLNFALEDIWAAVLAGNCDLLALIDKHIGAFARKELNNNAEKQNLLRAGLIWSLIGSEVRDGQTLRKEVLSAFNAHVRELVDKALAELPPPPATPNITAPNTAGTTTVTAAATPVAKQPVVQEPRVNHAVRPNSGSSRPANSRRKEKREKAAAQKENPQTQTAQATPPSYPPSYRRYARSPARRPSELPKRQQHQF